MEQEDASEEVEETFKVKSLVRVTEVRSSFFIRNCLYLFFHVSNAAVNFGRRRILWASRGGIGSFLLSLLRLLDQEIPFDP